MFALAAALALPLIDVPATYREDGGPGRREGMTMADEEQTIEQTGNGHGLWSRLYELGARLGLVERAIERHDQYGPRLETVEHDIAAIRGEVVGITTHLGQQDAKLDRIVETQETTQKATERRLLIAEGALASYVAGEKHRREHLQRIERAIYMTGTAILTPLVVLLFSSLLNRTHTTAGLPNDITTVLEIVVLIGLLIWVAYRTLRDAAPGHGNGPPGGPSAPP